MNKLRLIILLITWLTTFTLFLLSFEAKAVIYYVSSSSGDDSNSGITEDSPWRSLEKVNNFYKLSPGDQVLFKRGDEWTGSLKINTSGISGSPIIYGAYGIGNNPKFYGSEQISDWTVYSANIYKASFGKTINQLFLDDSRMKAARFPDEGYAYISAVNNSSGFSSSDLKSDINYKGAKWVGRTITYAMVTLDVVSSAGQAIQLSEAPYSDLNEKEGFFLVGKLEFLDSPGEWYYDTENKTVYIWTPNGDSPDNYTIRGSVTKHGVEVNQKKYVTIRDIDFLQNKDRGISLSSSSDIIIEGNTIINPDSKGIYCESGTNNTISNNIIKGANHFGIELFESNALIVDNKVYDIFLFNNIGLSGSGEWYMGSGIFAEGNDNQIRYNFVKNSGYNGIHFNKRNVVEYNFITNVLLTKDDGGGIYTSSYNSYPNPATDGSIIRYNIIDGAWGTLDGFSYYGFRQGFGIYLDENAGGVTVEQNTVANCSAVGIGLHKSFNETIQYNTVFNATTLFNINTDLGGSQFNNNILYTLNKSIDIEDIQVLVGMSNGDVIINYNTYINHYNTSGIFRTNSNSNLNFSGWKNLTGQDANSTINLSKLNTGETEKLFYNETKQTLTFYLGNAVFKDVNGATIKDTFSLKPYTSKILTGKEFSKINRKPEISDQTFNFISPKTKNDTIGIVYATEPDSGQILNYAVVNNDADLFAIHPSNGRIYLTNSINTSRNLYFEITVSVSDNSLNSLSDSAKITIHITGTDISPPVISSFSIPDTSFRLKVPVYEFTASDDLGVTGYFISQTSASPLPDDENWVTSPPLFYTFSQEGNYILYAWTKDSTGNISNPFTDFVFISSPDTSAKSSVYLFEEPSGITVIDSNGNYDGIIISQVSRADGVAGKGVEFSGQGNIDLGECFGENVTNELTISLWIKPIISSSDIQGIVTHAGQNQDTYGIYLLPKSKGIEFRTSGTSEPDIILNDVDTLWNGDWHHLVAVYNGTEKIIYLDNKILTKVKSDGIIDSGWKYDLYFGAGNIDENPSMYYYGSMDEVRIYNYALNNIEIQQLFHPINKILKKIYITEYVSICQGKDYLGWEIPGTYERVLKRIPEVYSEADSIVTTILYVNQEYRDTISEEICEGEIFSFGDTDISNTGEYIANFQSVNGCDSIVTLNLVVNPSSSDELKISICQGESYLFDNQQLYKTGLYAAFYKTTKGCDSIINLSLNVIPPYNIIEEITISPTENYLGWTNEGTYQRNLISSTGCDSIVITHLTVKPINTQRIPLEKGWNIISSPIIPENKKMEIVMESLLNNGSLVKVMDERDSTFEHGTSEIKWVNNIGDFEVTEGYKIKMESSDIIEITGFNVSFPLSIDIKEGLNLISFPLDSSIDAMQIMKTLIADGIIDKIQDERGNAIENWSELGWINGIGNFDPGKGYIVHANNGGTLTINKSNQKSNNLITNTKTEYFNVIYEGNGLDHMNINIIGLEETMLESGDEVAAFDNNICVGAIKLSETNLELNAVSIPASASEVNVANGFTIGNSIILKVWRNKINEETNMDYEIIKGQMIYNRQASVFLRLKNMVAAEEQLKVYPNPAKDEIYISIPYQDLTSSEVLIFDAIGRKLLAISVQSDPGIINVSYMPSGVYFIKLMFNNKVFTEKFIVTKN